MSLYKDGFGIQRVNCPLLGKWLSHHKNEQGGPWSSAHLWKYNVLNDGWLVHKEASNMFSISVSTLQP